MIDPFLKMSRPHRVTLTSSRGALIITRPRRLLESQGAARVTVPHSNRAHSKFSASAADRWFACSGSVELSEGIPDRPSPWSIEGTKAHEVLEAYMRITLSGNDPATAAKYGPAIDQAPNVMRQYAAHAARFIFDLADKYGDPEILVEDRVYLDFIHPEAFGTFDGAVIDHFGTLHVFDFKYGAGHPVSVKENLQMIFYGLGLAHKYDFNFKRVRLWIIQPRIKGYDGPTFWELPILELKAWISKFQDAVRRVEKESHILVEGPHCRWCRAAPTCPMKTGKKLEKAKEVFSLIPVK